MDAGHCNSFAWCWFHSVFLYQKEKKKRLQRENLLLHQEAELSGLREKEIRLQNKEAELREALFRRIAFFRKLPSLHNDESQDEVASSRKIVVTDAEWIEGDFCCQRSF